LQHRHHTENVLTVQCEAFAIQPTRLIKIAVVAYMLNRLKICNGSAIDTKQLCLKKPS
jgi:hypothetical protein